MTTATGAPAGESELARLRPPLPPPGTWLPQLLGVAILFGLWIVGGRAGWADGYIVTPADALRPIFADDTRDLYWRATKATASAATRGLLLGSLAAILCALAASAIPATRRSVTRLAALSNAAPWVVVGPCLLIVLGRDSGPVGLATLAAFFPVFVSTSVGLTSTPRSAVDAVLAHGGSRWRVLTSVRIPSAWPAVLDGLRIATPTALAATVFGEWYGAPRGVGVLLVTAMQGARPDRLWAASVLAIALGAGSYAIVGLVAALVARRYGRAAAPAPLPARRHRSRVMHVLAEVAGIAAFGAALVGIWWAWIRIADVSPLLVPSPGRVFDDLVDNPGVYLSATGHTLATAGIALLIGAAVGFVAAVAAAWSPFLAGVSVPFVVALAATPLIALFPLLARVLGYEPTTVRALAALLVFFPVFVNTRSGLLGVPAAHGDVVHSFGGSRWCRFHRVVVPSAVPRVATGLRLAVASSVVAAVVGESLIGREGLGVEFTYAFNLLDLPHAFGSALVIVVVSLAVFAVASAAETAVHGRWT
jgi:ABC-type nitrate/sulfonate/bicarbonate transport system permease component